RVLPRSVLAPVVEAMASLVTGHPRRTAALLSAWPGALADLRVVRRKRLAMTRYRQVGDTEVRRLQTRGSARLAPVFRGHTRRSETAGRCIGNVLRAALDMF